MKVSTRGRYALRMLADLAINQGDGYVSLKDIAERQHISKKYLEQIIPLLNRKHLLKTARGFQGGYRLSMPPEKYTLDKILEAAEGSIAPVACLDDCACTCPYSEECLTLPVWEGLQKTVNDYLGNITLADVIEGKINNKGENK